MWKNGRVPAFTLIECLVALLVLSGSLLLFDGMSRLLHQEMRHQEQHLQADWLVFANQLMAELEGAKLVKVENNRLQIDKAGKSLSFGVSKAGDFRKTNGKGQGYQPMLYKVSSCAIQQEKNQVTFSLTFDTGLERSLVYAFPTDR